MKSTFYLLFFFSVVLFSCKKESVDPNEGELITTVKLEFTDLGTGAKKSFEFKDLDGEGGAAPSKFDEIVLSPGKTYNCEVYLLNESVSPADNITSEVEAEGIDHQIYYTSTVGGLSITDLDKDEKGLVLGLESKWTTGAASTGNVNVTLKHKPGTKAANDPIAKGDTDVSIDFKVKVQ
jgi:hypothetical protein